MKWNLTKITKTVLDLMFIAGIFVVLTLPFSLNLYEKYVEEEMNGHEHQMVVILAICGVFALMIIWELRKMFKTVLAEDCFVKENVISLNLMGTYAFIIAIVMAIRCVMVYLTLAAISMVMVFIIAGLFSKVLAQVFDKAVAYKLENDFTI